MDNPTPVLFALGLLRLLLPGIAILIFVGSRVVQLLNRWFKKLQKRAFADGSTPSYAPIPDAAETEGQADDNVQDGIKPVVVPRIQLRDSLIVCLYVLLAFSYVVGDGTLTILRALLFHQWENSLALLRFEVVYFLAFGILFALVALVLQHDRRSGKLKRAWKAKYPNVLVVFALLSQIAITVVFAVCIAKYRSSDDHIVFPILHLTCDAARVLILATLALCYLRLLQRKQFVPVETATSSSYGTFENATQNGTTTPPKTKTEPEKPNNVSFKVLVERIRILSPYLYPKNSPSLQLIALICFFLLAVGRVVNLLVPIVLGWVVQTLSTNNKAWTPLTFFIVLKFFQGNGGIITAAQNTLWIPVSQYSDRQMTLMTFNHLLNLSMSYHSRRKTGEVLRVLDRGSAINNFFQMLLFQIVPIFVDIGVAIVYLGVKFGILLSGVVLLVMVTYTYASVMLTQMRVDYRRRMNAADKACRGIHTDALMSVESVKLFTNELWESKRYATAMQKYQKEELKVLMSLQFLNLVQNVIFSTGLLVGCLTVAFKVTQGQMQVSEFVTFVSYMQQLYGPLNALGTLYRVINQNVVDTEMLLQLLQEPKEIEDKPDAVELKVTKGVVEFDNVSFSYDGGKTKALDHVSFTIPAGKSAAFVGPSGSGKSTLFRLLFRFYDVTEGTIRIDGVDIRNATQKSLRASFGVVPQDAILFNESIRYNIRYAREGASDEAVEEAAKHAQIHDKILSFPDQYDTVVGERGVRLSGGEKQRVSIARVMLRDPPLLMLDEATSALDTATEREIQASLRLLQENRTSMAIAHRLSSIVHSDIIFVVKDGKIEESGSFGELIEKKGLFETLWQKQIQAEEETEELVKASIKEQVAEAEEAVASHH